MGKIQPGFVVGRCQIVREIGRGGMGGVYLAAHKTLKIDVALKILSPNLAEENPALADRFIREAQLAARVRHPNVVAVMDADLDATTGLYYMIQEYVGGGSLSWHLRHGPLPERRALEIVTGIAHALIVAEENGIVHRDIKPDNILIDTRGVAKLADLGLAKQALDTRSSLTLGGSFMGTPAYMSPDQARDAKSANTRDDIYSLGASFFECLTGQPPFRGDTPYNIMSELLTKPTPQPRKIRPDLSESVDLVCRKMMAKNRQLRYEDAHALVRDLDHLRLFGETRRYELQAAQFEDDRLSVVDEARSLGIETSAEGVALIPDRPSNSTLGPMYLPPAQAISLPRRKDYGVFGAAGGLIFLVTLAMVLLVWFGPYRPLVLAWVKKHTHHVQTATTSTVAANPPAASTANSKPVTPATNTDTGAILIVDQPDAPAVRTSTQTAPNGQANIALNLLPNMSEAIPVAPAAGANESNFATPALPVDPAATNAMNLMGPPPPAKPVEPDSAFKALPIAIMQLGETPPRVVRIIGQRTEGSLLPLTWTFYFYDENKWRNARYITVGAGQVISDKDPGLVSGIILHSYREKDVIPEDQRNIDSDQAYAIAASCVPSGVTISSSALDLSLGENEVIPMWTVRLWKKTSDGEEKDIGTVELSAKSGEIYKNQLKQD